MTTWMGERCCLVYTIILLKSVAVSKVQVAILARLFREMSQTVRIDWQYILSQVRVTVRPSNFFTSEKHTKAIAKTESRTSVCWMRRSRSIASDNMSGNNSDHEGERLSQNGDNKSLYLHELEKSGLGLLFRSLCVCIVCVKINNDELFFKCFSV